jgi:hypothetical protein
MSNDTTEVNTDEQSKNEAINQFYFIIAMVIMIVLFLLGLFIYNLIICYFHKWMNEKKSAVFDETEIRNIVLEEI